MKRHENELIIALEGRSGKFESGMQHRPSVELYPAARHVDADDQMCQ